MSIFLKWLTVCSARLNMHDDTSLSITTPPGFDHYKRQARGPLREAFKYERCLKLDSSARACFFQSFASGIHMHVLPAYRLGYEKGLT